MSDTSDWYWGPNFTTAAALTTGQLNEESNKAAGTSISLYPNPVRDILHLDNLKGTATISILTQDGRVVDEKMISNGTVAWNVKNLAAGTYFMRIEEETKITMLKFIKQ